MTTLLFQIQSVLNICGYVNLFITPYVSSSISLLSNLFIAPGRITCTLICHFLLDLHRAGHIPASTSSLTDASPIQFVAHHSSVSLNTLYRSAEPAARGRDPLSRREDMPSRVPGGTEETQ